MFGPWYANFLWGSLKPGSINAAAEHLKPCLAFSVISATTVAVYEA